MTQRLESPEQAAARLADERMTEGEQAQLWQRIARSSAEPALRNRRRTRVLAFGLPALAAAASLLLWMRPWDTASSGLAKAPIADACTLDPNARVLHLPKRCAATAVQVGGDRWTLGADARLARVERGVRIEQGHVRFEVQHRTQAPFWVQVSDGEVRVVGTVFEIQQDRDSGSIAVSEGVIEFVWRDGTRDRVAAGERLHWPRTAQVPTPVPEATPTPTPAPKLASTSTPDAGTRSAPDLDQAMERLLQLRSQKRFPEAVALLRKTLSAHALNPLQRERISYELGLALEASGEPSCKHWQRHLARFGSGDHREALAERIARCKQQ